MPDQFSESVNPWTKITEEEIYDNPWITVFHHTVKTPSGNDGIYGKVHFKNLALGIIPLDEDYNTWIVGQYRYPHDQYSWEIPEGGGTFSESALESAQRELLEETGITAGYWENICEIHLSNSVSDETGYVFVAKELSFGKAQPEETEQLQLKKIPFNEAFEMVMRGEMADSMTVAGILKVKHLIDQGKL
tara:strand:+ start:709 stop:1278 length:570 start_codon:yes stop_codon:yes gene_type:complete